jgi:hypothetical protein
MATNSVFLPKELQDNLEKWCDEHRVKKSMAIRIAVERFISKNDADVELLAQLLAVRSTQAEAQPKMTALREKAASILFQKKDD